MIKKIIRLLTAFPTNEELTTVNEQLQNRNQELSRLGDALTNLQASANVAMVEMNIDLRVRRFTPAAGKVLNLVSGDIGRPIDDIRLAIEVPDFKAIVTEVTDGFRLEIVKSVIGTAAGMCAFILIEPMTTSRRSRCGVRGY